MKKPCEGRKQLLGKVNKRDDRGSAIVIVIIAMALIGIMATTILWAAYLNYRIKINDLKVKNSFYSAETVVEQIQAGVKLKVSEAINEAYQDVISNWDALGTDANRESYFLTAYIAAVESKFGTTPTGSPTRYDKDMLKGFVDSEWWLEDDPNNDGYIVNDPWDTAIPEFKAANSVNGYGSMSLKNICIEYYDSNDYLSIINTDIAIDVPKLRFTQAGTIDRLYPYVLIGDEGIEMDGNTVAISGSIYGGVDKNMKGGIQVCRDSHVTIEDASYIISGGDIVVGNDAIFSSMVNQNAELIVRNVTEDSKGFRTNVYANGLALNGGHLDASARMYIANDLILSGKGSNVSLTGQYYGYGNTNETTLEEEAPKTDEDGNVVLDGDGKVVMEEQRVNPANSSSAIVINGKNTSVDLTGLTTLQLAGRAYVSLYRSDEKDDGMPHVLMGESISVKSNQIAYLVPAECVGTLNGRPIIGQNPVSFETWAKMLESLPEYQSGTTGGTTEGGETGAGGSDGADEEQDFRIVDASREAAKLGGAKLIEFGIPDIKASDLTGVDLENPTDVITKLNQKAVSGGSGVRFLYKPEKAQVYLYLVMDKDNAAKYFTQYYNVNSNKASLDNYFNQYVSGGIRLKGNVQGYTVVGNSMVSATDAGNGDTILTTPEGEKIVRLLSSVESNPDGDGDEGGDGTEDGTPAGEAGDYQEVSDNVEQTTFDESELKNRDEIIDCYENLMANLLEDDPGTEETVFENLVKLDTNPTDSESIEGLQDYLDHNHGIVEFTTGDVANALEAVLVDSNAQPGNVYKVSNSKLRLVVAIGDVEVTGNFQGLIIASGKITVSNNAIIKKDGEGVYAVLQAQSKVAGDTNVPANILCNGSGMVKNGYEEADVDESGNLNIDYSKIVRYENWIKK
ncbi:MAG: hypothetical protein K2J99_16870 [Lachnospiraceae bacterium]|nr:hypothetical protein [Lachnospiraceae bacterium]